MSKGLEKALMLPIEAIGGKPSEESIASSSSEGLFGRQIYNDAKKFFKI